MSIDTASQAERCSDFEARVCKRQRQLHRLRSLQDQNSELLPFERLLSELSSQFIAIPPDDVKNQIVQGLGLMARFLAVDQIGIVEFTERLCMNKAP